MKEHQIVLNIESETPEKMLDLIVDVIKDTMKEHKFNRYISDVYWDEI